MARKVEQETWQNACIWWSLLCFSLFLPFLPFFFSFVCAVSLFLLQKYCTTPAQNVRNKVELCLFFFFNKNARGQDGSCVKCLTETLKWMSLVLRWKFHIFATKNSAKTTVKIDVSRRLYHLKICYWLHTVNLLWSLGFTNTMKSLQNGSPKSSK